MTKFRICLWLGLGIIVAWLFYMKIVPSGKISYVYDFKKPSRFINKLSPEDRVEPSSASSSVEATDGKKATEDKLKSNYSQKIIGDPIYFSLFTPRRFNKAKLILKYRQKQNNNIPIIEAGVLADKTIWRYDLQPIENQIIDKLALTWNVIEENGLILLQRDKKYNSIEEFLKDMPDKNEVALYNTYVNTHETNELKTNKTEVEADRGLASKIPEAKPLSASVSASLRGPYQFYAYVKSRNLNFDFTFIDLNENKDKDPIELRLYYDNKLVNKKYLDDDIKNEISEEKKINFQTADLQNGIYKIELYVNDDIITEQIITKQEISFIHKIWIAKQKLDENNLIIYTDSDELRVVTTNPDSLQTIKIDGLDLEINKTYKQFHALINGNDQNSEIKLQKSDIILAGNGVFSFNKDSLINPVFKKVDANLKIDAENNKINYILAKYNAPTEHNGWKTSFAEFDLTKAYQENGKYNFLISIPGLRADDDIDDWVKIDEIKVELEGKTLQNKILDLFTKLIKLLSL